MNFYNMTVFIIEYYCLSSLSCSLVMGDERDNRFTPRRWAELEEAVAPRTQDMSKLKLIGEPVLSDDESSEQQIQMAR